MAKRFYEVLFLLDPNKASADFESVAGQANGAIERFGGEIYTTRSWVEPKLAYPIKNFRKGVYLLTYFYSDTQAVANMEADWRLNESVLRYLTIVHVKVIEDNIIAQLNGEQVPMMHDDGAPMDMDAEEAEASLN